MDVKAFLHFIFVLHLVISDISGIPSKICNSRNKRKHWNPNCENIFMWNNELDSYASLLNVTFPNNSGSKQQNSANLDAKKIVRVIADNMLPYITSSNFSQEVGGYLGDIWLIIEDALKFRSNITSVFYDTGLDIITSGKADVMLAAAVEKKGLLNIYYSQPYFNNWYHLFIKTPEAKASSMSYLNTFSRQLWFMSLLMFFIMAVSIWSTTIFLHYRYRLEANVSLASCLLAVFSGLINQAFVIKVRSYSLRVQIMFALIFGVMLYSAINAVLVAKLAVFEVSFPFTSLHDVAEKRTHSLCVRTNSFVYNNFTNEDRELLPFWKGVVNGPGCSDINNQTNLALIICNENIVVLENRVVLETIMNKRINKDHPIRCDIMNLHHKYFPKGNSFLLLKSFSQWKSVDGFVKKMRSTGILQRLEDKWVRREKLVNVNTPRSPQVTLDHTKGVLVMYSIMILISIVILAVEMYCFRRKNRVGLKDQGKIALFVHNPQRK